LLESSGEISTDLRFHLAKDVLYADQQSGKGR
jgi:hypothetical protein